MNERAHGKHRKRKIGAHKGHSSPETLVWNREHLIPRRPNWMDERTYVALARLRSELEGRPA